ncbi:MAG: hypothetical protein ACLFU4_01610 [Opitutales bacterium]
MDLDIHQPQALSFSPEFDQQGGISGYGATLPPEIPEAEQQDPNRCQILINNDNDDLDSLFSGSGIVNPYPADNDDSVLKVQATGGSAGANQTNDDDVVMVTLREFDGVDTGKIRLTTSDNTDVELSRAPARVAPASRLRARQPTTAQPLRRQHRGTAPVAKAPSAEPL